MLVDVIETTMLGDTDRHYTVLPTHESNKYVKDCTITKSDINNIHELLNKSTIDYIDPMCKIVYQSKPIGKEQIILYLTTYKYDTLTQQHTLTVDKKSIGCDLLVKFGKKGAFDFIQNYIAEYYHDSFSRYANTIHELEHTVHKLQQESREPKVIVEQKGPIRNANDIHCDIINGTIMNCHNIYCNHITGMVVNCNSINQND